MTIAMTEKNQVYPDFRIDLCGCCSMPYGTRKVTRASDESIIHSRCHDTYENILKRRVRAERQAKEEAEKAKIKAKHDANKERRGTCLDQYCDYSKKEIFEQDVPKFLQDEYWFFERILAGLRKAGDRIAQFKEDVGKNPSYHMSWSMQAFEAAAVIEVHELIMRFFENGLSVEEIKGYCEKEIFRAARSTSQSTSPASNVMDREILAAWTNARSRW